MDDLTETALPVSAYLFVVLAVPRFVPHRGIFGTTDLLGRVEYIAVLLPDEEEARNEASLEALFIFVVALGI